MNDIYQMVHIDSTPEEVFKSVSTPAGFNTWWTESAEGKPENGAELKLNFGTEFQWKAKVTKCDKNHWFEMEMTEADDDWAGTKVGFIVHRDEGRVKLELYHIGWPEINEHFKISSYCWAIYLNHLKKHLETGELVPYEERFMDTVVR